MTWPLENTAWGSSAGVRSTSGMGDTLGIGDCYSLHPTTSERQVSEAGSTADEVPEILESHSAIGLNRLWNTLPCEPIFNREQLHTFRLHFA